MKLKDAGPGVYRVTHHRSLIDEVTMILIPRNNEARVYLLVAGHPFLKLKGDITYNNQDDTEVELIT